MNIRIVEIAALQAKKNLTQKALCNAKKTKQAQRILSPDCYWD